MAYVQRAQQLMGFSRYVIVKQELSRSLAYFNGGSLVYFAMSAPRSGISEKPLEYDAFEQRLRRDDAGFQARLRSRCASFSHREIQIIVLIRLGIDSTDAISKVLPLLPGTIDNICYHIRKKLGLKKGEKLYQAILSI